MVAPALGAVDKLPELPAEAGQMRLMMAGVMIARDAKVVEASVMRGMPAPVVRAHAPHKVPMTVVLHGNGRQARRLAELAAFNLHDRSNPSLQLSSQCRGGAEGHEHGCRKGCTHYISPFRSNSAKLRNQPPAWAS
jgi:hypothetical protein